MPVDFQSIHSQVLAWGEQALREAQALEASRVEAGGLLGRTAGQLQELRERVEQAVTIHPALRCADPVEEALDARMPMPGTAPQATLFAADGSQVVPNPHGRVEFGVINIGVFQMCADGATPPLEIRRSTLLGHDNLYTRGSLITDEGVALMRDLEERAVLVDLAARQPGPVVALTDGPLEIFAERVYRESGELRQAFDRYLHALLELASLGTVTAGYVDRPRYDMVVRLLELAALNRSELDQAGRLRPFAGVRDRDLYAGLLAPGERSAIFRIQSPSAHEFQGELALHFFYLNVGRVGQPALARVELPAWVVHSPAGVDLLHATLVYQSRLMGSRPYPYALHRAHEIAVIRYAEAEQLEQMLLCELARHGIYSLEFSNKQFHKQAAGRTRHTL